MVVSERVAQSVPPMAQVTAPDVGLAESDAAVVASEGAALSVPPEAQTEVAATATSLVGSDAAMVASEGVAQSWPPAAQAAAPEVGRMEEDTAGGSLGVMAVVERTRRRSSLGLLLEGSRSPARGEPLLQWMAAQDPTSVLFSLDDASESMERKNLDIRFSAVMDALSQAGGALREILNPSGQVPA